jgi:hypothetical protein
MLLFVHLTSKRPKQWITHWVLGRFSRLLYAMHAAICLGAREITAASRSDLSI